MPALSYRGFVRLLAFCGFLASTHASAVELQLLGGLRNSKWEYELNDGTHEKAVKATEVGLSVLFLPSPKLPFSIGFAASHSTYDMTKILDEEMAEESGTDPVDGTVTLFSNGKSDLTGLTYGPELMAWIPLKHFRPFLRAGYGVGVYNLTRKFDLTIDGLTANGAMTYAYNAAGANYGLGFIVDVNKNFGFLMEYHVNRLSMKAKKVKITTKYNGTEETTTMSADELSETEKNVSVNSAGARLGLTFSF